MGQLHRRSLYVGFNPFRPLISWRQLVLGKESRELFVWKAVVVCRNVVGGISSKAFPHQEKNSQISSWPKTPNNGDEADTGVHHKMRLCSGEIGFLGKQRSSGASVLTWVVKKVEHTPKGQKTFPAQGQGINVHGCRERSGTDTQGRKKILPSQWQALPPQWSVFRATSEGMSLWLDRALASPLVFFFLDKNRTQPGWQDRMRRTSWCLP